MTDAPRRTRLELDWEATFAGATWSARAGDFHLAVVKTPSRFYWRCDWAPPEEEGWHLLTEGLVSGNEEDAMLAAESWLAEAVREPAERLGGGGVEREEKHDGT